VKPPQSRLKELLHYAPNIGVFTWIVPRVGPKTRDNRAGSFAGAKYRMIGIDGRRYMASHLAWLYMTGDWPTGIIDHINQDKLDDRWGNLRLSDPSRNRMNTGLRSNNTSGIKGVHFNRKSRKWVMQISCRDKKFISAHSTAEKAAQEYNRLAAKLFNEHATLNDLAVVRAQVAVAPPISGNTRIKRTNRERVRRWYACHIGCHQAECAAGLGLSSAAVYRHIRDLRVEWLDNRMSTQTSILDLYAVVTE
jgi:hypothetical protein